MTKIRTASAIIFASALLVLLSGCSKENDNIDFGEHTEFTQTNENISENVQVTENPSEITFSDPVIGGSAILSQDTLDNLTAALIIRDLSHLPDGTETGNYYGGKFIVVELKDNKSGVTVENILPETSYTYENFYSTADESSMMISADCAADSIKLLCIENNGKKEYILKAEYIQFPDRRLAAFACCDMSRYEEDGGYLKWYTIGNYSSNVCMLSPYFAYKSGNKFCDSLTELEYEFDTENLRLTVSEMNPADIVFGEPEIGKNSILSQSSLDEYSAVVEIHNILAIPENDDDDYGKSYTGEKLFIKLIVNDDVIAYGNIPNGLQNSGVFINSFAIPEKCTGEGATRIFQVEQNGKNHYIVMQYCMYDKESDTVWANFACFDSDVYEKYKESPDEVLFPLIWYDIKHIGIHSDMFDAGIQVSDSFEYVGGGVFRDSVYGYELTFDCENLSAEAA